MKKDYNRCCHSLLRIEEAPFLFVFVCRPSALSNICGEYGADTDSVFYAFDNEWQEEHHTSLLLLRFGAALLWLVLAVGLGLAGWRIFKKEEAKQPSRSTVKMNGAYKMRRR